MSYDALDLEVNELLESIQEANKTEMNVLGHIPKDLCIKQSQIVTSTILE